MHLHSVLLLEDKLKQIIEHSNLRGTPLDKVAAQNTVACMTFRDYMSLCLYDEQYGYYRHGPARVGKEGDFYTSSAVGDIMATLLAKLVTTYQQERNTSIQVVEWGAGTGKLLAALANAIQTSYSNKPDHPISYTAIEDHPSHVKMSKLLFQEVNPNLSLQIFGSQEVKEREVESDSHSTFVIANELLDALPVHRVCKRNDQLVELAVTWNEGKNSFEYAAIPLSNIEVQRYMTSCGVDLQEGQMTEVCADAREWLDQLSKSMKHGRVVLIDYGHRVEEYMADHRMEGTLLTYSKHLVSDSPFIQPGQQDITAHVNFSYMISVAEELGFEVVYYDTQLQFLIDQGILQLLADLVDPDPFSPIAKRNRAIRQLLLSDQMSETFKVLMLEKRG